MDITNFLEKFVSQFEETDASTITAETKFRDLEEWSSLVALSIIAMVDEEYNRNISGNEIKKADTVQDLFNIVKAKM